MVKSPSSPSSNWCPSTFDLNFQEQLLQGTAGIVRLRGHRHCLRCGDASEETNIPGARQAMLVGGLQRDWYEAARIGIRRCASQIVVHRLWELRGHVGGEDGERLLREIQPEVVVSSRLRKRWPLCSLLRLEELKGTTLHLQGELGTSHDDEIYDLIAFRVTRKPFRTWSSSTRTKSSPRELTDSWSFGTSTNRRSAWDHSSADM